MSSIFKLNTKDFVRGLIVTVIAAFLSSVLTLLNENGLAFSADELRSVFVTALSSGLGYLLKNLATDDEGKLGGKFQIK